MEEIVIKGLWISSTLGNLQASCIESFLKRGHVFHLYSYSQINNMPDGVILKDANEIIPERYVFKDLYNSYATFSDWFRVKLLFEKGGWWSDCDVLCVRKFDTTDKYVFATEIEHVGDKKYTCICNAVLKMPKGSNAGKQLLGEIEHRLSYKDYSKIKWTEIGAELFIELINANNLSKYIVAPEVFCPVDYRNFRDIVFQENMVISKDTYGIHLWNKMWEWSNEDPVNIMSPKSLLNSILQDFREK